MASLLLVGWLVGDAGQPPEVTVSRLGVFVPSRTERWKKHKGRRARLGVSDARSCHQGSTHLVRCTVRLRGANDVLTETATLDWTTGRRTRTDGVGGNAVALPPVAGSSEPKRAEGETKQDGRNGAGLVLKRGPPPNQTAARGGGDPRA